MPSNSSKAASVISQGRPPHKRAIANTAVAPIYRLETRAWGQPTDFLGYDPARWHAWFNEVYVPSNNAKIAAEQAIEDATRSSNAP